MTSRSAASMNDTTKLGKDARAALERSLGEGEPVRVVVAGTFGSALIATDRRVLIWKKHRLNEFRLESLAEIVFGRGPVVRWIQVRGPSVGLAVPSLLNVGELPDTIQIGPVVDDRIQPVLEMLVAGRGGLRPREAATAPVPTGAVAGQPDGSADEPPMEAIGAGGRLLLFRDRVRIEHRGFRGFLRHALPAAKEVRLDAITTVAWRDPGNLRLGRIGLCTRAGPSKESRGAEPENTVMFYLHQQVSFREIRAAIERRKESGEETR
jgi:hypothetical protein